MKKKRTILQIFSGDLWAGAEVVVFNLLTELKTDPDLKVIALSLNEGILADRLRGAGIETHVIEESKNSFPVIFLRSLKLLAGARIDVIHAHRYKENLLAVLIGKTLRVKTLISTIHGLPNRYTADGDGKDATTSITTQINYYLLKNHYSRVIAVSGEIKSTLTGRHGFDPAKVEVIHNGIPPVRLSSANETTPFARPSGSFHIGTVGRMYPQKDYDLFLETAAEIIKTNKTVRFSILGDGPLKERLELRCRQLRIEDRVALLNPVRDPTGYYLSLDLYLSTSLYEGTPLSILEAMACGNPVVAPAVGGIPEIIRNGEDGFLSADREPAAFARLCISLINDESLRAAIGENNRRKIADRFTASRMADNYKKRYVHQTGPGQCEGGRQRTESSPGAAAHKSCNQR